MATKKTADWIAGKTVEQILDLPFNELNKLTESQLKTAVGRLVSAGNKRLRRFEEKRGKLPNAGKQGDYEQVKFSTVGKDKTELLEEFKRARSFMRAETSSLAGYKRVKKKTGEGLKEAGYKNLQEQINDMTSKNYDRFWQAYEKLKELKPEVSEQNLKYVVLEKMGKYVQGKKWFNVDKLVQKMEAQINSIYEEEQRLQNADGTSGFFEV